jgi:hypothetical protein
MTEQTVSQDSIPDQWIRAMQRADRDGIRTQLLHLPSGDLYLATSASEKPMRHNITVNERGKIVACDCKGFENGHICKHMGAWAKRLMRERAIKVRQPAQEPVKLPQPSCSGKSQIYQEEVA